MGGTIWDQVLGRIETKVNRYSYYTWFRHTQFAGDDGRTLTVRVTDPMVSTRLPCRNQNTPTPPRPSPLQFVG